MLASTKNEASNSPLRVNFSPAVKRPPAYIYLRGSIYYFRYALPKPMRERFGKTEVRMSLRTGFVHQARKYARRLHTCLEDTLMADNERSWYELKQYLEKNFEAAIRELPNPHAVFEGAKPPDLDSPDFINKILPMKEFKPLPELVEGMLTKIDQLYPAQGPKIDVSMGEIRERMAVLRQELLDERDSELYDLSREFFIDNTKKDLHSVSAEDWLDQEYYVILKPLTNDPDKLILHYFPTALIELIDRKLFKPEEYSRQTILPILNEYHKVKLYLNRIYVQRERGDYLYEKQFPVARQLCDSHVHNCDLVPAKEELMLSKFIEQFINTKISDGQWVKHGIATHKDRIYKLTYILGDIPLSSIDRKKMREFRAKLVKVPANQNKKDKYKGKSIDEIVKMDVPDKISISTVNTILETISGMFEWGIKESIIENNPAKGLSLKDDSQDIEKRDPFTENDIKTLFFSGDYSPTKFKHSAYYWAPLIALYTGMRLEEICQLHVEDVYKEDNLWIFDITTESSDGLHDKILKTKNARRKNSRASRLD